MPLSGILMPFLELGEVVCRKGALVLVPCGISLGADVIEYGEPVGVVSQGAGTPFPPGSPTRSDSSPDVIGVRVTYVESN